MLMGKKTTAVKGAAAQRAWRRYRKSLTNRLGKFGLSDALARRILKIEADSSSMSPFDGWHEIPLDCECVGEVEMGATIPGCICA